jgi:hypothetical protein
MHSLSHCEQMARILFIIQDLCTDRSCKAVAISESGCNLGHGFVDVRRKLSAQSDLALISEAIHVLVEMTFHEQSGQRGEVWQTSVLQKRTEIKTHTITRKKSFNIGVSENDNRPLFCTTFRQKTPSLRGFPASARGKFRSPFSYFHPSPKSNFF